MPGGLILPLSSPCWRDSSVNEKWRRVVRKALIPRNILTHCIKAESLNPLLARMIYLNGYKGPLRPCADAGLWLSWPPLRPQPQLYIMASGFPFKNLVFIASLQSLSQTPRCHTFRVRFAHRIEAATRHFGSSRFATFVCCLLAILPRVLPPFLSLLHSSSAT